jgi:hypothetical protein
MKTSELTGAALDWAVAVCEEWVFAGTSDKLHPWDWRDTDSPFTPSTEWAQGGPIIERERLSITPRDGYWDCLVHDRLFEDDGSDHYSKGATPLIAAMRCYVASKLGDEVEVPNELINRS